MIIIGFFCFTAYFGKTQNIYHYFGVDGRNTISTGVTQIKDTLIGVGLYADTNNIYNYVIYSNDSLNEIKTLNKIKAPKNGFFYIEQLPPQIDLKGRICHIGSVVNQTNVGDGRFVIYDKKNKLLIDSLYKKVGTNGFADFTQHPDSSFILFGTSNEFDTNGDFYVVHVDKNGGFISDTTYGITNREERGYAIAATPDSGYVFTGYYRTTPHGHPDFRSKIVVYKIDKTGKVEWNKLYGGEYINLPYSLSTDLSQNIYIRF